VITDEPAFLFTSSKLLPLYKDTWTFTCSDFLCL